MLLSEVSSDLKTDQGAHVELSGDMFYICQNLPYNIRISRRHVLQKISNRLAPTLRFQSHTSAMPVLTDFTEQYDQDN